MKRLLLVAATLFAAAPVLAADKDPYKSAENLHTVSTAMQVVGIVSGLAGGGLAVAAYIDYDQYKRSTSPPETEQLRTQIQTFDKISVICGVVAVVFVTGGIVTYVMYKNKIDELTKPKYIPPKSGLPHDLDFALAPLPGGGLALLSAKF